MCSSDMKEFIEKYHLDLSLNSKFNARDTFGSHDDSDHIYNTPRTYDIERYFNPHTFNHQPFDDDIPWSQVPEKKITVEDVKYVLSYISKELILTLIKHMEIYQKRNVSSYWYQ